MTAFVPLPPGQQLAAPGKWPVVGERAPSPREDWTGVEFTGLVTRPGHWTFEQLQQLPQVDLVTDIHCVTRWSKLGVRFRGVLLSDLLQQVQPTVEAKFVSLIAHSDRSHSTSLPLDQALELRTMLALACDGQLLPVAIGGPLRVIVPGRYFYKSLKWLARVELLAADRLGFWEGTAGYHNHADPWREERFVAPRVNRMELARRLTTLDFEHADLLGLDLSARDLPQFRATRAMLRNADFRRARLAEADFSQATLSNARFQEADLRGASLRGADLEGADFSGADLRGADLRDASLFGTTFSTFATDDGHDAAIVDETTQFSAASLEALTPEQRAVIRRPT